jgi:hypothetical protein
VRCGLLLALALATACDAAGGDDTTSGSTTSGDVDTTGGTTIKPAPCPLLCDESCPPECLPDPCGTVGDWCALGGPALQCGVRMACEVVPKSGSKSGVCVAPCSASEPCARGECDLEIGACFEEGFLAAPFKCEGG